MKDRQQENQEGRCMMEAYSGFARVYDLFMDDVPYDAWRDYLVHTLQMEGIAQGLVCELGCGTGRMTRMLAECGYDMIGIDASGEMLSMAREHGQDGILYLEQDMREFELYGTVRAVISICDSMNYLLEEQDMRKVFQLVNNYLDPGGLFLFDLNTIYKFRSLMGQRTFCEHREAGSLVWENYYDEESRINEYSLTLFIKEEKGLYRKCEETHYERGYELDSMITSR